MLVRRSGRRHSLVSYRIWYPSNVAPCQRQSGKTFFYNKKKKKKMKKSALTHTHTMVGKEPETREKKCQSLQTHNANIVCLEYRIYVPRFVVCTWIKPEAFRRWWRYIFSCFREKKKKTFRQWPCIVTQDTCVLYSYI